MPQRSTYRDGESFEPPKSTVLDEGRSEWIVLTQLFEYLATNSIDYVLLGDTTALPEIDGDVDLCIADKDLNRLSEILWDFSVQNDCQFAQSIQHESTAFFCTLTWLDGNIRRYLQLDVCSDYLRGGRRLLSAATILHQSREELIGNYSVRVPIPAASFAYYGLKKIEKGKWSKEQAGFLLAQWQQDKNGVSDLLSSIIGKESSRTFITMLDSNEPDDSVVQQLQTLVKQVSRKSTTFGDSVREIRRGLDRVFNRNGMLVVLFGPDGCGKSTVNALLRQRIEPLFWRTSYMHLRPGLGTSSGEGTVVTDPHGMPPRSFPMSVLKLFYYWFDYSVGYLVKVFPQLTSCTGVVCDRYYNDVVVDPLRYRYSGPAWLAKLGTKILPRPDLTIVLDAPTEVIQSRKQEVTPEETERQRRAYHTLHDDYDAEVVDASLPPAEVVGQIEELVVDWLVSRMRKKLKVS